MRVKSENPAGLLAGRSVHPIVAAYFELSQLKRLYRQGWLLRGLSEARCETVADHAFAAGVLALWVAGAYFPQLDLGKILQMVLLHELGEIYAGDIVPTDGMEPAEKHRLEAESFRAVIDKIPGGESFIEIWEEFEAGETPEARFVRQIDRLEMGLQAGVYQLEGASGMAEFLASARRALEHPRLVEILDSLEQDALAELE